MVPVSWPPCPASMTTRESFKPRLRTSDLVPAFVSFAGVIAFVSVSAVFLTVGAGFETDSTEGGTVGVVLVVTGNDGGLTVSFPSTSMINLSGSRRVKVLILAILPTSSTIRTVDASYCPTRICCRTPDLIGHCLPARAGVSFAGSRST